PALPPLSLHDALPIWAATCCDSWPQSFAHRRASKSVPRMPIVAVLVCTRAALGELLEIRPVTARKPPRTSCISMLMQLVRGGLRSEEHTSELQSRGHL